MITGDEGRWGLLGLLNDHLIFRVPSGHCYSMLIEFMSLLGWGVESPHSTSLGEGLLAPLSPFLDSLGRPSVRWLR